MRHNPDNLVRKYLPYSFFGLDKLFAAEKHDVQNGKKILMLSTKTENDCS